MVAVRIHRHAVEVLAKAPITAQTNRQEAEVAVLDEAIAGPVRIHRHSLEVLSKFPARAEVTRQEAEVAALDDGIASTARIHRHALEVLVAAAESAQINRQEIEVAFLDDSSGTVRIHRHALEVLGRAGVPPIEPLPLPAGLDVFLHNYASVLEMETQYSTDITRARETAAEERRVLLQRPERQIRYDFLHEGIAEVDRLFVTLRRITNEKLPFPVLQDEVVLGFSDTGQNKLNCDPRYRRFFDGGRVAVYTNVPVAKAHMATADIDVYVIRSVSNDGITVDRNLDQIYTDGDYRVVPYMDTDLVLEPEITQLTDDTARVGLVVNEDTGKNSLPPSFVGDTPDGWQMQLGYPIFEIEPNWAQGLQTRYRRYGQRAKFGRKTVSTPDGPRYLQEQIYQLLLDRQEFWQVLQFFDSRRGRADPFWEVDQEFLWTVTDTDPTFIDVSPLGQFADFDSGFTSHAGIVLQDGTVYIREVNTIQEVGGSWRLTLAAGNPLPTIDVSTIRRFSRARLKRFASDALREVWRTTDVAEVALTTIEVLGEGDVTV